MPESVNEAAENLGAEIASKAWREGYAAGWHAAAMKIASMLQDSQAGFVLDFVHDEQAKPK